MTSAPAPTARFADDLADLAAVLHTELVKAFPETDDAVRQTLALAEEAGEFVQAARRWLGLARTPGDLDTVAAELADVAITAFVTAEAFGIDLPAAVASKATVVSTRGWRTAAPDPTS